MTVIRLIAVADEHIAHRDALAPPHSGVDVESEARSDRR